MRPGTSSGTGTGIPILPGRREAISFSSAQGPLPESVRERARALFDGARRYCAAEEPFNSAPFQTVLGELEADLRSLLAIPATHRVLFVHGGASAQFAAVPLNLGRADRRAEYLLTGYWSQKALVEAVRFIPAWGASLLHGSDAAGCWSQAARADRIADGNAAYTHLVSNETADGLQLHPLPDSWPIPLVADMSSDFLTRVIDLSAFGVVYASAQKSLGVPGFAVVVLDEKLLGGAGANCPAILDYGGLAKSGSRANTPSTLSLRIAGMMTRWLRELGGVAAVEREGRRRSALLYETIDASGGFYRCPAPRALRSRVTVCFQLPSTARNEEFLAWCESNGALNLRGHPSVGGIRAALYPALPPGAAETLTDLMKEFHRTQG